MVASGSASGLGHQPALAFGDLPLEGSTTSSAAMNLTPKKPRTETSGLSDVFPYYAGFSFEWACNQINKLNSDTSGVLLDPWNGSGTTTAAGQHLGVRSIGVDLNPVANIVAKFRSQNPKETTLLDSPRASRRSSHEVEEPLRNWLAPATATRVRDWEHARRYAPDTTSILVLVSLFNVVRNITSKFEGSNPTWVRRSGQKDDLVSLPRADVDELIINEQSHLLHRLSEVNETSVPVQIVESSTASLPMKDSTASKILTSPPYLTRLDYAVSYMRELAVLGHDITNDRSLRSQLMGTTLIRRKSGYNQREYGSKVRQTLAQIAEHPSKASSGYYHKQAHQYFADLTNSFDEITRVAAPGCAMAMVVQDSYYKDVHIDLADICENEASLRGWTTRGEESFDVKKLLTSVNTAARAYKKGNIKETVLTFMKD